jgi:hypothetical protein
MLEERSIYWSFEPLILSLRLMGIELNTSKKWYSIWRKFVTLIFAASLVLTTVRRLYLMRIGASIHAFYNLFSSAKKSLFSISFYQRIAANSLLSTIQEKYCFCLFLINPKKRLVLKKLRKQIKVL